jgi:hypothetical protein
MTAHYGPSVPAQRALAATSATPTRAVSDPTLEDFSNSDAFMRGLMGPFGSGKSSACVTEIVARAQAQEPGPDGVRRSRWGVVRNTFGELTQTTLKTIFQWLPQAYFGRYIERTKTYTVTAFPGCEFEIVLMALDRPDDVKRLLSLELTGAWVNEAREVPWGVIEVLQGRVGRYPSKKDGGATWWGVWLDTNPPDADSRGIATSRRSPGSRTSRSSAATATIPRT